MAFPARDGSMHHSAGRASLHDELSERRGMKGGGGGAGEGKPGGAGGSHKDVSHMDIAEVVKKHGPAHQTHTTHDHENDAHHVTTHHGDAGGGGHHVHKSKHASAADAHGHTAAALGLPVPESIGEEQTPPEEAEEAQQKEQEGGIPGIEA
jgi:hypothetical protein